LLRELKRERSVIVVEHLRPSHVMSEVTDVWLLAVALDGENSFWLCEPTNLKPLADDWKMCNCRWLYPVVENVSRFADFSGFESTDAVYEVEWSGVSKVLRAATLAWNMKCKRQKMDGTTYVFVPAEEIKLMDDAYSRFVKLEAMKPPPPRSTHAVTCSDEAERTTEVKAERTAQEGNDVAASTSYPIPVTDGDGGASASDTLTQKGEEAGEAKVSSQQLQPDGEDGEGSVVSFSVAQHSSSRPRRNRSSSYLSFPSHKRQTPHQGTTTYQAPVHSKPMGDHRSDEAFDWPEMFVIHRGSVDYLCPQATNNTYGFRLDRVLHNGFPVFLLFSSNKNNSESIDASARGVPVFEKAKLSGEGGEGAVRSSVLVVTRLSSKKHQPYYRKNTGRKTRRRRSDSDEDSITEEEEEEASEDLDDDDEEESSSDTYNDEFNGFDEDDRPLFATQPRHSSRKTRTKATPTPPKRLRAEPAAAAADEASAATRRRSKKDTAVAARKEEPPLQAVSVNFWTDPHGVTPAVSQLAREFPFHGEGADTPQTVVFSDGVCVTYTAATAAKHASQKRRNTAKHGHAAASVEDADLSMLNEHILNAFAQVRRESA
jgi:hypothetical protein